MERFVVLDSWRGIAACMVVLFHLDLLSPNSHLHGVPFVRHSYLFVDFFFVLSGFVIAANYQQRLLEGFGAGRFLLLRLGRLYPLHFAMLAATVALKLLQILIPALSSFSSAAPFSAPQEAPDTILANLLLVHSLHLYNFLTWTPQSWSISTEFYTYAIFAACLVGLRKHGWIALLIAMIGAPVLIATLSAKNMDTTYDWGIIRCVYGFAAGVICWNLYQKWRGTLGRWLSGNAAEWCTIALIIAFVSASGTTLLSIAAPYVFGLAVLVFAFESGTVSAFLRLRPLVFLGTISYSIYMTHVFVVRRTLDADKVLDKLRDGDALTRRGISGLDFDYLGAQQWGGDLVDLVRLATIIAVSYFTYRWIEKPGRDWVRNRVQAQQRTAASRSIVGA